MHSRARSSVLFATLWLLGLAAGCSDDGGAAPDAAPPIDAAVSCSAELPDPPPPANGDISGTWGLFSKYFSNAQGVSGSQITRSYYLQEYTQNGDELTVTETLCNIEIDAPDAGTSIRLGPGFAAAQPQVTRAGSIITGIDSYEFSLELTYIARGVELADLENEELPTDPTDPRVQDADNDGNPGLTLLLDGILTGQLFEVQRDFTELTGTQTSADRIEGLANWGSELSYLGSDPEFLLDLVGEALPDSDPSKHTFEIVRLPAGSDCAYILDNRCDLYTTIDGNE